MKSFKYISIIVIAALLASCTEKIFDLEPDSSVIGEDVFKSYATANATLTGTYAALGSSSFSGLYDPIISDLMGEDIKLVSGSANYGWFKTVYQMQLLSSYTWVESPWSAGYATIYSANDVIENSGKIEDATADQIDRLIGEAKAIRAYCMLQLTHLYCDAFAVDSTGPGIVLTTRVIDREEADNGRSTLAETYASIIEDLKDAEKMYLAQDTADILDYTRLNVKAVQGLLARAYLDKEDWTNARNYAVAAADYSTLAMHDGATRAIEALNGYGFSGPTYETLFSYDYTTTTGNTYESMASFYFPCWGYSSIRIPESFLNLFDKDDTRYYYFLNKSSEYYDGLVEIYGDDLSDVYKDEVPGETITATIKFGHRDGFGSGDNIKMRLAEMYLIEAEAEVMLEDNDAARAALYKVQSNYLSTNESENGGADLLAEILLERRKELFGEGFRLNDIKRRQQTVERSDIYHWVAFSYGPEDEEYYKFVLPIPKSEIDANDELTEADQNYGY